MIIGQQAERLGNPMPDGKLGVDSRAGAIAAAAQRGLLPGSTAV